MISGARSRAAIASVSGWRAGRRVERHRGEVGALACGRPLPLDRGHIDEQRLGEIGEGVDRGRRAAVGGGRRPRRGGGRLGRGLLVEREGPRHRAALPRAPARLARRLHRSRAGAAPGPRRCWTRARCGTGVAVVRRSSSGSAACGEGGGLASRDDIGASRSLSESSMTTVPSIVASAGDAFCAQQGGSSFAPSLAESAVPFAGMLSAEAPRCPGVRFRWASPGGCAPPRASGAPEVARRSASA